MTTSESEQQPEASSLDCYLSVYPQSRWTTPTNNALAHVVEYPTRQRRVCVLRLRLRHLRTTPSLFSPLPFFLVSTGLPQWNQIWTL